jgi:hypothetical protein
MERIQNRTECRKNTGITATGRGGKIRAGTDVDLRRVFRAAEAKNIFRIIGASGSIRRGSARKQAPLIGDGLPIACECVAEAGDRSARL